MRAWLYCARNLREPSYRLIRDCTASCAAASRIKRSREGGVRCARACVFVSGRDYNAASVATGRVCSPPPPPPIRRPVSSRNLDSGYTLASPL